MLRSYVFATAILLVLPALGCHADVHEVVDRAPDHDDPVTPSSVAPPDAPACPGSAWSSFYGDGAGNIPWELAVAADCSIVSAGSLHGELDFGGNVLDDDEEGGFYMAKLDRDGEHLWSQQHFGFAPDVAIDPSGDITLVSYTWRWVVFASDFITDDYFVAKLGPDGTPRWGRAAVDFFDCAPSPGGQCPLDRGGSEPRPLAVDAEGGIHFASWVSGSPATLRVVRLDKDGNRAFLRVFEGEPPTVDYGKVHVAASTDSTIVTAEIDTPLIVDGETLAPSGVKQIVVVSLDATGDVAWSKLGGLEYSTLRDMVFAPDGDLRITGHGASPFNDADTEDPGDWFVDYWVSRVDPAGTLVWQAELGASWPGDIGLDAGGHASLLVMDRELEAMDLIRFGPNAYPGERRRIVDVGPQGIGANAHRIAVAPSGESFVSGLSNSGDVIWTEAPSENAGEDNMFIMRVP